MKIVGLGAVAGMGFTVSLFVTNLAFAGGHGAEAVSSLVVDQAKLGIIAASVIAAVVGAAILRASAESPDSAS